MNIMNWFFASGDLDFFWKEQLAALSWLPQVFRKDLGFGVSGLLSLWLDYPFRLGLKLLADMGISWFIIEKLLWISVFSIGIYASYRFASYLFGNTRFRFLSPVIYMTNTYILLLFSGGQLGVAWAYAFTPWVLLKFIESMDNHIYSLRRGVLNGLYLAILVVFDIRLAYIALALIALYLTLYAFRHGMRSLIPFARVLGLAGIVAVLLHAFWILPTIFSGNGLSSLGSQFTDPRILKFLSFADFSHALSFLHPNWPENLFGKVYFLQPEFLLLPVLAFASLLMIKKRDDRLHVFFLACVGLTGVFLAKGVNDPFGGIFQWLFIHVPGFISLRDPTKFYLLIAVSYALLIPHFLSQFSRQLKKVGWVLPVTFLVYWCFTVRAVFLGQVGGNFRPLTLPNEYIQLKDFIVSKPDPFRTLWIPEKEKFAFYSDRHPLLVSDQIFQNASISAVIAEIDKPGFKQMLANDGIRYIIVPIDIEKRLFMNDYRYDPKLRNLLVEALEKTDLVKRPEFHDIAIFENKQYIMRDEVPAIVSRQQRWANIGAMVSGFVLLMCIGFEMRRK